MTGAFEDNRDDAGTAHLLAEGLEPIAPGPAARDAFVAEIRGRRRYAPFAGEVSRTFGVEPDAVRTALERVDEPAAWRPGLLPGSRISLLPGPRGVHVMLARLPAGTRIPRHAHAARERTYVINGTLIENGSRRCGPGDLIDMLPGSEHDLAAVDDECLVVFEEAIVDPRSRAS
jgi:quercetin dioxygenase-like cupin family protein